MGGKSEKKKRENEAEKRRNDEMKIRFNIQTLKEEFDLLKRVMKVEPCQDASNMRVEMVIGILKSTVSALIFATTKSRRVAVGKLIDLTREFEQTSRLMIDVLAEAAHVG
ncbi:hypothetical protein PENTCL1PPCAC_19237 [Pristionchus entomophagus]|uniref:Uncharacterized protein n=1 Tax=Pristionchus entomophagus TaxID=358040 RepID=A0AAV5TRJ3_9BILA|nr:hypothetical protein PENTCL1PPCAC_19237 [Pristionchus entomophagus]